MMTVIETEQKIAELKAQKKVIQQEIAKLQQYRYKDKQRQWKRKNKQHCTLYMRKWREKNRQ